jgi:hypothetical protein
MSTDPTATVDFDSDELVVATAALEGTKSVIMTSTTADERRAVNEQFLDVSETLLEYFAAASQDLSSQPQGTRRDLELTGTERFTLSTALGHAQAAGDLPGCTELRFRIQTISAAV